jgi:hypothetical protein
LLSISSNDLFAFDAIGYDLVPEPSGLALLLAPVVLIARRTRRRAVVA